MSAKPLFGEYRNFGENPPAYEEIAKYVFYTETSRQWNPKAMDSEFLKATAAKDPNGRLMVYAEKIWLHRSALREWEAANGKTVRTMILPFNLR